MTRATPQCFVIPYLEHIQAVQQLSLCTFVAGRLPLLPSRHYTVSNTHTF